MKSKFFNGWTSLRPYVAEDLHNEFIEQFEEIPPFKVNKESGEVLNKTVKTIWKKIDPINIYKMIQSEAESADLTKKIESLTDLNERKGVYIDNCEIGNIHEIFDKKNKIQKELISALQKEKLKNSDNKENNVSDSELEKDFEKDVENEKEIKDNNKKDMSKKADIKKGE